MCCTWKGWWGLAVARGGSDCLPQLLTRRSLCSGVGTYFDFPLVGLGRCGFSRWCSSRCVFFQFFWTNCFATNSCVNQRYALKPDIFFYFPSSGATVSCAKNRGCPCFFFRWTSTWYRSFFGNVLFVTDPRFEDDQRNSGRYQCTLMHHLSVGKLRFSPKFGPQGHYVVVSVAGLLALDTLLSTKGKHIKSMLFVANSWLDRLPTFIGHARGATFFMIGIACWS